MIPALAFPGLLLLLASGVWATAVFDRVALSGGAGRDALAKPLHRAAALLSRQPNETERPDTIAWKLAPALYLALAAAGLSVVPLARGAALADFEAGIVLWGAVEALTVVVVFLHGWAANSQLALMAAYRYVAIGLPVMLVSMFVLIAAALPAESLSVSAIVESQRSGWNLLRQPLGLILFLLLGLSLSFRGPFNYADSADLAGGTATEVSGASRLIWEIARLAILVSFAAMASAVFLGGYLGPLLPGPLWMLIKTLAVLAVMVAVTHAFARLPPSRMLTLLWTVLLPLAFVDLAVVGLELVS